MRQACASKAGEVGLRTYYEGSSYMYIPVRLILRLELGLGLQFGLGFSCTDSCQDRLQLR